MTALVIPLGMLSLGLGMFHVTLGFWPAWVSLQTALWDGIFLAFPASWTGFRIPLGSSCRGVDGRISAVRPVSVLGLEWRGSAAGPARWVVLDDRHRGGDRLLLPGSGGRRSGVADHFYRCGTGGCHPNRNCRGGRVILVDGGGTLPWQKEPWQKRRKEFEVGERCFGPLSEIPGNPSVDWMVMTHGDADHIGGLRAVVEELTVAKVLRNPLPPGDWTGRGIDGTLLRRKDPGHRFQTGNMVGARSWGIRLQVLHPPVQIQNPDLITMLLSSFC